MSLYPFFFDKLAQIEELTKTDKTISDLEKKCADCQIETSYQLSNIVWSQNVRHLIKEHQSYPSEFFVKVILCTCVLNNQIINPPIILPPAKIKYLTYIYLHYNKLLIIDALMHQGSYPRYENDNRYIYSEHCGIITLKNQSVDNIIVSTDSYRTDPYDESIFLPRNGPLFQSAEYIFHTHPNTNSYGGRLAEGIIYEFPSANDVMNFVKYYHNGRAKASLVIAPEGSYVIRPRNYIKIDIDKEKFHRLRALILQLEKKAIQKYRHLLSQLNDPDIFHQTVGSDYQFINAYNRFLKSSNLHIEYYPREKKNNEWCLRSIYLQYVDQLMPDRTQ